MNLIFFSLLFPLLMSFNAQSAERLRIATWNVQNLFDSEHDIVKGVDKWDYAFLPAQHPDKALGCQRNSKPAYLQNCLVEDWTRDKVLLKYQQIKKMVATFPQKPDILVLIEVENHKVLQELSLLLGYQAFLLSHWDDERGLDTAVLFNPKSTLKLLGSKPVAIPLDGNLTRPILQVQFSFAGQPLHLYVNHWPMSASPEYQRRLAASQIRRQIELENRTLGTKPFSVALGDFNVNSLEFPRPFTPLMDSSWDHRLFDLDAISRQYQIPNPQGTHFFVKDRRWELFDRIFVSGHFFSDQGLKIPINKYKIIDTIKNSFVLRDSGEMIRDIPFRYNHETLDPQMAGFSDHFPVYFEIVAP